MSDVIGRGVIELVADARKLKAGIDDAKRSVRTLGEGQKDISKGAAASIDNYIGRLNLQNATLGKSVRETELYKLALRGASNEQLRAADVALRFGERQRANDALISTLRTGLIAAAVAASGTAYAFDALVKKTGDLQDVSEKTGDSAENMASLSIAAAGGSASMEQVSEAAIKLTKNLTGVDDESKAAGAALAALGLKLGDFKKLSPADQLEAIGKALNGFAEGPQKTAVAIALLGKTGADMLPFLKELGKEGSRQIVLTNEQIRLADDYSDRQAILRGQISLYAQSIAVQLLPAIDDFTGAIKDLVKDQEFAATASDVLGASLGLAVAVFQTIAVVGSDVGFMLHAIGTEIGGIAAQIDALAHGDISGFHAISDAMKADAERARAELDRFQARVLAIGANPSSPPGSASVPGAPTAPTRPQLKFNGAAKDSAADIAKAQLAADLDKIKQHNAELTDSYARAQKIMEARHAANLINDKAYYEAKLGFITLNSRAQEQELEQEITRLQREKLSGKDKIENAKAIADAQAKLSKVRADAVAEVEVNSIQEAAANTKVAQSYVDARVAADAYIESVKRRNQQELEGIGRGEKFRGVQEGRNEIEDKFISQRQSLERDKRNNLINADDFDRYLAVAQDTYAKEIALYDERTEAITRAESDWTNGANEAMRNYYDEAQNTAKLTENVFTDAFQGMEDALVEFATTGKLNFSKLANSILADITRIIIKQQISNALGVGGSGGGASSLIGTLGNFFEGSQAPVSVVDVVPKLLGNRAGGGAVDAGALYRVNEKGPELLNYGGSDYLMMGGQGGFVKPVGQEQASDKGRGTVVVNMTVNTPDAASFRQSKSQILAEYSVALRRTGRNL